MVYITHLFVSVTVWEVIVENFQSKFNVFISKQE